MVAKNFDWTAKAVETLRRLRADGKPASYIAHELGHGLTRNAIIGKLARLRVPSPPGIPRAAKPDSPPRPARPPRVVQGKNRVHKAAALAIVEKRRAVFKAEAVAAPVPVSVDSLRVNIVDLKDHMCKWPLGDPKQPGFSYCGLYSGDRAYCPTHCAMAYNPEHSRAWNRKLGAAA